jgi:heme oxygenase
VANNANCPNIFSGCDIKSSDQSPPATRVAGDASFSALRGLREATGDRHALLDSRMPLAAPMPGLREYRNHLRLLRAWLLPLEAWLAGFADGPQGPSAPPFVERLPLIEADLADPAMPLGEATLAGTTRAWRGALESLAPAYRWGLCYVIEGSQLGGAVLHRRLAPALAPHPLRFLRGGMEGPVAPGPRWQAYLAALEAQVRTPADIALACRGACDAFDRLLELLRENPALAAPAAEDALGKMKTANRVAA